MQPPKQNPRPAGTGAGVHSEDIHRHFTSDPAEGFKAAMRDAGIEPPDIIKDSGKIERFSATGKRGDDSGWYVFHSDGIPAGAFGDWRSGETVTWTADLGRRLTAGEIEANRRRIEAAKRLNEAEMFRRSENAVAVSRSLIETASIASADHPYLRKKKVKPVPNLRELPASAIAEMIGYSPKSKGDHLQGRILIAPVMTAEGAISTCELIDSQGRKSAIAGGRKGGAYWVAQPLNQAESVVLIGEGIATVLSAREATGYPVIAALSGGNLKPVAHAFRERYPEAHIVILADLKDGAPYPDAIKAAKAINGHVAIPVTNGTDFNDMFVERGLSEVSRSILSVLEGEAPSRLTLISGSDIKPEAIDWLWDGWLAKGKFHVLAGPPGTGKTTIATALAASLTSGSRWPDGARAVSGNVIIWSGEDDPKDTLAPRLIASGADMSRVWFIGEVREDDAVIQFDPSIHLQHLEAEVNRVGGCDLLIVDPIVSAIAGDSHKNAEVRRGLQPLVTMGASLGCAILGITHFTKGTAGRDPVERVNGSIAFGALARVVFAAAKMPESDREGGSRLFCRSKSNIGADDGGFRYDLDQVELPGYPGVWASRLLWGTAEEGSARDLLARAETMKTDEATDEDGPTEVDDWLREFLSLGPKTADEVFKAGRSDGFTKDQLKRAKYRLGVVSGKHSFSGPWAWSMPEGTFTENATCDPQKSRREQKLPDSNMVHPSHPSLNTALAVPSSDCSIRNGNAPLHPSSEPSNCGVSSDFDSPRVRRVHDSQSAGEDCSFSDSEGVFDGEDAGYI